MKGYQVYKSAPRTMGGSVRKVIPAKYEDLSLDALHPCKSWTLWHVPVTLALGRWFQDDLKSARQLTGLQIW